MHGGGSLGDERDALLESERPGRRQRGVLAEAVAGAEVGVDAESLDGVEHHQAGDERGELGVAGVSEFVGVGVEQQGADIASGDLAGFVDEFPTVVIDPRAPHTRSLRPLSGERECEHRGEARRNSESRSHYRRVTGNFLR